MQECAKDLRNASGNKKAFTRKKTIRTTWIKNMTKSTYQAHIVKIKIWPTFLCRNIDTRKGISGYLQTSI